MGMRDSVAAINGIGHAAVVTDPQFLATRLNDRGLGVANRDTWTITAIDDGTLTLRGADRGGARTLPVGYARANVELAYATTIYGAQGETTSTAHLLLGEHTTGSSAYVGMTRGRDDNVAHIVAETSRTAGRSGMPRLPEVGPTHAARRAAEEVEWYAPHRPLATALAELRAAWTQEENTRGAIRRATQRRDAVAAYGQAAAGRVAEINVEIAEYAAELDAASSQVRVRLQEPVIRSLPPGRVEQERTDWRQHRDRARKAAVEERRRREAARRQEFEPSHGRNPDRGRGIGL